MGGVISSTRSYFLEEKINLTGLGVSIERPVGGMTIEGHSVDISGFICTDDNYTLFTSPIGGCGDVINFDVSFEISGTGSQVYDLVGATGNELFEEIRVDYNNCTSKGTLNNFGQGLEEVTRMKGGNPQLILDGTWSGGYVANVSNAKNLTDGVYSLYKAGATFVMNSRFVTNQNIDLPASASFIDFSSSNFINSSNFIIKDAIITRNGISDPEDPNITPNATKGDLTSNWSGNNGILNTHVGIISTISTEVVTVLTQNTQTSLLGTYAVSDDEHFSAPTNGQSRNDGDSEVEYTLTSSITIQGGNNDIIEVTFRKWDNANSVFEDIVSRQAIIINSGGGGGLDAAYFDIIAPLVILRKNDYVDIPQVTNLSSNDNVTAKIDSFYFIKKR